MKSFTISLPLMFGDHHVVEVRRILLETPGVQEVYASSSFQVGEIKYDESQVTEEQLCATLEKAGYLGDMPVAVEIGAQTEAGGEPTYRHTAVYPQTSKVTSFEQKVSNGVRPLWPCPGIGTLKTMDN